MRFPSIARPFCVLSCWLLLAGSLGASPSPSTERGFPLIQSYQPADPVSTQNFGIARDPRGVIYVANEDGVLVYDGAWWRVIPAGKAKSAFSVASDAAGRVAVGGIDDLGLLEPDAQGTLRFVSLLGLLPPAERNLGQVMSVQPVSEGLKGFAFLTKRSLLLWDGKTLASIAAFPAERPYPSLHQAGAEILVWTREGLMRLAGRRLVPVPGGEVFRGRRVDTILPADRSADGGLIVSVRGEGLFLLRGGQAVPFAPAASRWTAVQRLIPGASVRLADGRLALGSILGGLLLMRPDGEVDQVIDTTVGLSDDFVNGVVVDREGALWLGPNGEAGPEAAWSFRVLPPWYATGWATALWSFAALLLVIGYSRLRSRALRQRAARLEARVAEQTLELRHTVAELSRAHAELEVANERLETLSLQDDLTRIANRRHLQQVLESEWKRARRYQRPLGFILLDLDHFKLLNDTRGHLEGDLCLQAVARYLDETVRRTGDLVARYGGEELAVLLPDTDLDGALRRAEQLRRGIEDLGLPHEAAPAGHITASFGVAATVPAPEETPDSLIETADIALYRAKTEGRNRVRAGGGEMEQAAVG